MLFLSQDIVKNHIQSYFKFQWGFKKISESRCSNFILGSKTKLYIYLSLQVEPPMCGSNDESSSGGRANMVADGRGQCNRGLRTFARALERGPM